jgi:hypothetical protein
VDKGVAKIIDFDSCVKSHELAAKEILNNPMMEPIYEGLTGKGIDGYLGAMDVLSDEIKTLANKKASDKEYKPAIQNFYKEFKGVVQNELQKV